MDNLIYPHEKKLFMVLAVISIIVWIAVIIGTLGVALIFIGIGLLLAIFAQSRFISYFHGTGAIVTEEQFPELYKSYVECCDKLEMKKKPTLIVMQMGGMFNAFATKFLRKYFVILLSDVVDALDDEPEALKFYMGHELGHIKRKHLVWMPILAPASWLPLIGSGYSRAREYTCDRHGRACCADEQSAIKAMAVLAVGAERWKTLNVPAYLKQKQLTKGFWMSLHEITSDYPWLVKRIAKLHANRDDAAVPRRNPFAWVLGIFIPRFSIMSLIMLYALIIFVAGGLQGQKLIQGAQKKQQLQSQYNYNYNEPEQYVPYDAEGYPIAPDSQ